MLNLKDVRFLEEKLIQVRNNPKISKKLKNKFESVVDNLIGDTKKYTLDDLPEDIKNII